MPCRDSRFPDGTYHTVRENTGNFAGGIWVAKEEGQEEKFVVALRKRPMELIKVKWAGYTGWAKPFVQGTRKAPAGARAAVPVFRKCGGRGRFRLPRSL